MQGRARPAEEDLKLEGGDDGLVGEDVKQLL